MADTISKEHRSWNMSRIKGKDTKPEVQVRRWLFRRGYRFRKNDKRLPGVPDVVLPRYKTVIFVIIIRYASMLICLRAGLIFGRTSLPKMK